MLLPPVWRMLCFALASGGILQIATELACWRIAQRIDVSSIHIPARALERRLLALTLAGRLLPWTIALGLLTPAYVRAEDNASPEHVSGFCIVAAGVVVIWIASTLFRAAALSWNTRRIFSACHASSRTVHGLSVFVHRGSRSLIAVMGIFHPRLLMSEDLLQDEHVSAPALEIALHHELAHAVQKDNLKLLLLAVMPSLPFSSVSRPSLADRWRLAAELAADEASTGYDSERSFLLAELLVRLARHHSFTSAQGMATLLSTQHHLTIRVEHLLRPSRAVTLPRSRSQVFHISYGIAAACAAMAVVYLSLTFGHTAAEFLLHLG